MAEIEALAHILEGEGGACGILGFLAIAHVFSRNDTMYGWQTPSPLAEFVAMWWYMMPDPTLGAEFLFSKQDLQDPRVHAIIKGRGPPKLVVDCQASLALYAY